MKSIQSLAFLVSSLWLLTGCNDPSVKQQASAAATTDSAADQGALNLIDLSIFPRLDGAINPQEKSSSFIRYTAPGKPVQAYEQIKQQLVAERWRELPGANISMEYGYANGNFEHHGYLLGVSTYSDQTLKPEGVAVTLIHHGKFDWKKIPLPADAKQDFALGTAAAYVTESSVEETIKNTKAAFETAGWKIYDESPEVIEFKKDRQLLHFYISSAPAKNNKTMIQIQPKLMAANIPLPQAALGPHYHDAPAKLDFSYEGTWDDVAKFYQTEMPKLGWTPTTENLIKNEKDAFQIYRNPEKAFLEVKLITRGEKTAAEVEYKSPGQFEEEEQRFKEALEKQKAEAARIEEVRKEQAELDKSDRSGKQIKMNKTEE